MGIASKFDIPFASERFILLSFEMNQYKLHCWKGTIRIYTAGAYCPKDIVAERLTKGFLGRP
jgi:hypothetical protein